MFLGFDWPGGVFPFPGLAVGLGAGGAGGAACVGAGCDWLSTESGVNVGTKTGVIVPIKGVTVITLVGVIVTVSVIVGVPRAEVGVIIGDTPFEAEFTATVLD